MGKSLDRYNELLGWAYELVEQGDVVTARHVFAEANRAYPDEWTAEDEERWQADD